ncbi:MAG TPA: hypothetical protein VFC84_01075 [Desulfosporosinus sp.]|nr:hypothetical protein [Desulfosporosinus sp.]
MIKVPPMRQKGKIIQILPAPDNLYAVYDMGLGFENEKVKVLCLALTDRGDILPMTMDDDIGHVEEAREPECFKYFRWKRKKEDY